MSRRNTIGGSDANIILSGDKNKIHSLWLKKIGEPTHDNLDDVLPVQMGIYTESFNAQWFEKQLNKKITNHGERYFKDGFLSCTLDGLTDDETAIWEAKHVHQNTREDKLLKRYMPQLQHNMYVLGLSKAYLSVFYGNSKWDYHYVQRDEEYINDMLDQEIKFWDCVQNRTEPV